LVAISQKKRRPRWRPPRVRMNVGTLSGYFSYCALRTPSLPQVSSIWFCIIRHILAGMCGAAYCRPANKMIASSIVSANAIIFIFIISGDHFCWRKLGTICAPSRVPSLVMHFTLCANVTWLLQEEPPRTALGGLFFLARKNPALSSYVGGYYIRARLVTACN
jgi:hypothetical protein